MSSESPEPLTGTNDRSLQGHDLVVQTLRSLGVTHAYSVSGTPIVETLAACVGAGIRPVGVRNEQTGVMMAAAHNYVSGRLAAVVILGAGPAVTNAATGILVARDNRWPLLVLGGRSPLSRTGMGAFQELNAVPLFESITKWSAVIESVADIPEYLARAQEISVQGAPGPVYLDLPEDVLTAFVSPQRPSPANAGVGVPPPCDPQAVGRAAGLLLAAQRPVMLLGEGVRWSEPYPELRSLVDRLSLPFITSPMGRGYLPDDHPLCFNAARSFIQSSADVVLLVGSRLNWIFRFGSKLAADAKIIQLALEDQEIGWNRIATVGIAGNIKQALRQLLSELEAVEPAHPRPHSNEVWIRQLGDKRDENIRALQPLLLSAAVPVTPHRLLKEIRDFTPRDAIVVVDGNIILAAARQVLPSYHPASRLDCGLSGCVGVGIPFAIGAKLARPDRTVISICGDCAFGFCAMEMETAVRNRIRVIVVVANNDGIGGHRTQDTHYPSDYPERVTTYLPGLRYEKIMKAFGGHSEYVERPEELRSALERAASAGTAACINVRLDPRTAYPGPAPRRR